MEDNQKSNPSALERLGRYFDHIADELAIQKATSTAFINTADVGTIREDIVKDFLERHLPKRCEVLKGGFVFDSSGNVSKQIDLIVTNDLTIRFRQMDKSFACIEGCYCAISVKTTLDKANLVNALENLASIPAMDDKNIQFSSGLESPGNREVFRELPCKVVFAFDGLDVTTLTPHINQFYSGSNIPKNSRADMI